MSEQNIWNCVKNKSRKFVVCSSNYSENLNAGVDKNAYIEKTLFKVLLAMHIHKLFAIDLHVV